MQNIPIQLLLGKYQVGSEESNYFEEDSESKKMKGDDVLKEPANSGTGKGRSAQASRVAKLKSCSTSSLNGNTCDSAPSRGCLSGCFIAKKS